MNMRRRQRLRSRFRDILTAFLLLGGVALLAAWLASRAEVSPSGTARVIDGDSLVVKGREIRLQGIDAPEFGQSCRSDGGEIACGRQALRHLRRLIDGGTVTCKGWQEDQYQRLLAICFARGLELNREMVADGWAVSYGAYEDEERDAKKNRRGLWTSEFERPVDWRRSRGEGITLFEWLRQLIGL